MRGVSVLTTIGMMTVMIVAAVAGYYVGTSSQQTSIIVSTADIPPPSTVLVSGSFSTKGFGTSTTGIFFVSLTSGISYPAQVSGNGYSISLANLDSYSVVIGYNDLGGIGGQQQCNAGLFPLEIGYGSSALSANWTC